MPRTKLILATAVFMVATVTTAAAVSTAAPADSLRASLTADYCGLWQINAGLYAGPASTALCPGDSWTSVTGRAGQTDVPDDANWSWQGWTAGRTRWLSAGAETRTRTSGGIITAAAGYSNASVCRLTGCETLEAPRLYPYLTADSLGGALKAETYSFSGSVCDSFGLLSLGVGASYRAALEYRQVDPRPRNVTGDLGVKFGAVYSVTKAQGIGLDLRAGRYRHSSQISFVNPLGGTVIYHRTGPQSHYVRFAGSGLSALYTGHNFGATLSLLPLGITGITAGVSADYSVITKQLVDLNRLPLSRLTTWQYSASLAWTQRIRSWLLMPYVQWHYDRRRGCENLFGDAAAGVYPLLASLEMYGSSCSRALLGTAAEWASARGHSLLLDCRAGVSNLHQAYRQPAYVQWHRYADWLCSVKAANPLGRGLLTANLGGGCEWGQSYVTTDTSLHWPVTRTMLAQLSAACIIRRSGNSLTASIGVNF